VSVSSAAILTLKIAGSETVQRVKLKCKTQSAPTQVKVLINDQSYVVDVDETLEDKFFDLPSKFYSGDDLSICLQVLSRDQVVVLRGIQIL
jgi:hypothetical protein